MKNQFLGMAAHDLRNPSGNIVALADMMLDEETTSLKRRATSGSASFAARRKACSIFSGKLLDISKIEAGKVEAAPRADRPAPAYVEEMRKRNRLLAERKKITLTTEVATGLPSVAFD